MGKMKKIAYMILTTLIITVLAIVRVPAATALSGCEDTCDRTTKNRKSFSKCMDSCKKEVSAKAERERNMRNQRGAIITDEKYSKCLDDCSSTISTQSYSSCIQKCKNAAAGK
jgi:hypothetical protein